MSLINKLVRDGIKSLETESKRFDQDYKKISSQIESTRKKMKDWKAERKIIRNK